MDLLEKCSHFTRLEEVKKSGLYPYFHEISTKQHSEVLIDGRRTIMLGSNNYLGLTSDQRVIDAAKQALDQYGTGCSGSRFLNGTLSLHVEMETKLAAFLGREAVLTFSTGFQTNLGILSALCGRHDVVFFDKENHASLLDGVTLSGAKLVRFPHNDMQALEQALAKTDDRFGKLIVVDGVFSMDGGIADLPTIHKLAKKYGARVMVDDSHAMGVIGAHGRGTGEHHNLEEAVDIHMGTFSKSFASLGGFMAASRQVVDYVAHVSRPFIFSASMPPANIAAVIKALEILQQEPERMERLKEISNYMRAGLRQLNIPAGDSATPIIPVATHTDLRTFQITRALLEHGVYVNPVVSPAVPEGQSILRTSYVATHTREQLDFALDQFDLVFNKLYKE